MAGVQIGGSISFDGLNDKDTFIDKFMLNHWNWFGKDGCSFKICRITIDNKFTTVFDDSCDFIHGCCFGHIRSQTKLHIRQELSCIFDLIVIMFPEMTHGRIHFDVIPRDMVINPIASFHAINTDSHPTLGLTFNTLDDEQLIATSINKCIMSIRSQSPKQTAFLLTFKTNRNMKQFDVKFDNTDHVLDAICAFKYYEPIYKQECMFVPNGYCVITVN